MSKQQAVEHTRGDLVSAFRIFDDDDDGCIHAGDLVDVLTSFGEKFSKSEARKLVQTAAKKEDGLIDYQEFSNNLLPPDEKTETKTGEAAPSERAEKAGEVKEGGEKSKN